MTPEDVLAALAARSPHGDFRRPDPIVEAARTPGRIGKKRPKNWRTIFAAEKTDQRGPSIKSAIGNDQRRVNRSATHEAAVDALKRIPKRAFQALQVSVGIDGEPRNALFDSLLAEARESKARDKFWPTVIVRQRTPGDIRPNPDYVPDMVELALLHLQNPAALATHESRARWFRVSHITWRRKLH
ncbi:MAG TPA: hypothetical protein PKH39_16350, partial [Woeseiaceae bacterium]|nr:hypothetical protein [Woeseiaceae bacterium]